MMQYDPTFIQKQVRDGWTVTETVKKVWSVQMDLLKTFDAICKRHGLRWFMDGGTLLGAVRHKGFIPWDDDVDLVMPREDYNEFLKIAPKELSEPYFLQTPASDPHCYMYWASLRNSDTTGSRECCMKTPQNNGIAIDIIPLEGCENSYFWYRLRRLPLKLVSTVCNTYVNEFNRRKSAVLLRKVLRKLRINVKKLYRWLEKQNSRHPMARHTKCTQTLIADPMVEGPGGLKRVIFDKADYAEAVELPFEDMLLPAPCGYDRILKQYYGDYMAFPPVESRAGKHDMVFEPDVPYKTVCAERYGVQYQD